MTHFRTYCIGEYDEDSLFERFSEHTKVEPYKKGSVSNEDALKFVLHYMNPNTRNELSDRLRHAVENVHDRMRKLLDGYNSGGTQIAEIMADPSFKELYDACGQQWNSGKWKRNDSGEWEVWSTYNPETVFDYFSMEHETTLGGIKDAAHTIAEESCGFFDGPANSYTRFENVGWFGYSESVMDETDRINAVNEAIKDLPADTPVYIFDCHI